VPGRGLLKESPPPLGIAPASLLIATWERSEAEKKWPRRRFSEKREKDCLGSYEKGKTGGPTGPPGIKKEKRKIAFGIASDANDELTA